MSAARKKGKWVGGSVILGYDLDSKARKLTVNADEARLVREIFALHQRKRSILATVEELNRRGTPRKTWLAKNGKMTGGGRWTVSNLRLLLTNANYLGKVDYQGQIYEGEHEAIVDEETWARSQALMESRAGGTTRRVKFAGLLKGLLKCGGCGGTMLHTYAKKGVRRYRYYVCQTAVKQGASACETRSLPAQEVEDFVVERIPAIGNDPGVVRQIEKSAIAQREERLAGFAEEKAQIEKSLRQHARWASAISGQPDAEKRLEDLEAQRRAGEGRLSEIAHELAALEAARITKAEIAKTLGSFRTLLDAMPPAQRARALELLVERVVYDNAKGSVAISFHPTGIKALVQP